MREKPGCLRDSSPLWYPAGWSRSRLLWLLLVACKATPRSPECLSSSPEPEDPFTSVLLLEKPAIYSPSGANSLLRSEGGVLPGDPASCLGPVPSCWWLQCVETIYGFSVWKDESGVSLLHHVLQFGPVHAAAPLWGGTSTSSLTTAETQFAPYPEGFGTCQV